MTTLEGDLHILDQDDGDDRARELADEDRGGGGDDEALRDEFVDAFNARDIDAIVGLVSDDVELPDVHGEGPKDLASELVDIWDRSPGVLLTRGFVNDEAVALAWVRSEQRSWAIVALVSFSVSDGQLDVVEITDDSGAIAEATYESPDDDEVEEGGEFSQWTDGDDS